MKIFGILNITPDSFSDGGKYNLEELAVERAAELIKDGADYIDVGAESTRPGAIPLTHQQELERLLPVLNKLSMPLAIDTYNPDTARIVARFKQVKFLNDVSGFSDPKMVEVALESGVNVIVMHSLTVPADKNIILTTPVIPTLLDWIESKFLSLTKAGIPKEKIIFDPGLGFGKDADQSREIIDNADILAEKCHSFGAKIYFGHSRKSFIGGDIESRDLESAKISALLYKKGIDFIRVHNVQANLEILKENGY